MYTSVAYKFIVTTSIFVVVKSVGIKHCQKIDVCLMKIQADRLCLPLIEGVRIDLVGPLFWKSEKPWHWHHCTFQDHVLLRIGYRIMVKSCRFVSLRVRHCHLRCRRLSTQRLR